MQSTNNSDTSDTIIDMYQNKDGSWPNAEESNSEKIPAAAQVTGKTYGIFSGVISAVFSSAVTTVVSAVSYGVMQGVETTSMSAGWDQFKDSLGASYLLGLTVGGIYGVVKGAQKGEAMRQQSLAAESSAPDKEKAPVEIARKLLNKNILRFCLVGSMLGGARAYSDAKLQEYKNQNNKGKVSTVMPAPVRKDKNALAL